MRIKQLFALLLTLGICNAANAQSTGHIGHGGDGDGQMACFKAKISHYLPEHLAAVVPGSEFSFFVSGSNGPGNIHVFIRDEPVQLTFEDKETFYVVKGKLPGKFKNEVVRVNIRVKTKMSKCDADGGFLLKVTE